MNFINLAAFENLVSVTYKDAKIFLVDEFFKKECLEEIKLNLVKHKDNPDYWATVPLQEEYKRKRMLSQDIELFRNIHKEMNEAEFIDKINKSLGWEISTGSFSIWHDSEGYSIDLHTDNQKVKHAIQIYLSGIDNTLGTSFAKKPNRGSNDIFLTIPYKENFGYCMKNVDTVEHGLIKKVHKDFNRYSIYCLFE
jgi:hypothetical protein